MLASPVQGKGFQVEKVPPDQFPTLVIFATGSGISPVRSLIESGELQVSAPAFHQHLPVVGGSGICSNITTAFISIFQSFSAVPEARTPALQMLGMTPRYQGAL